MPFIPWKTQKVQLTTRVIRAMPETKVAEQDPAKRSRVLRFPDVSLPDGQRVFIAFSGRPSPELSLLSY